MLHYSFIIFTKNAAWLYITIFYRHFEAEQPRF